MRWFRGKGIDIGCGNNAIKIEDWPNITEVVPHDLELGSSDAQFLADVPNESFDFVHSAHCLEHMRIAQTALTNWIRIVKPGGFVVVTIPDEFLYEGGLWPSRFNSDHKFSFTLRGMPIIPQSVNVAWLLYKTGMDVEHLSLLTDQWDPKLMGRDQTLGPAECAIEFVLRKPAADRYF